MQGDTAGDYARSIRVAAVQMPSENGRVTANLAHATPLIEQARQEGAQLVVLPEFMPTGYFWGEDIWEAAEPAEGTTVTWLRHNSKRLGIWLGTSFLEADGKDFFNTFVLTDPRGEVSGRVRKRSPALWEAYFFRGEPGSHAIDTPVGKVGVGICFDNQKTDVTAAMSRQSVDLVLMPHSYPVPASSSGMFTKEEMIALFQKIAPLYVSLLGVPVVLANKCGPWDSPIPGPPLVSLKGFCFPGLSTIIDSDGSVRAQLGDEEGAIVADVMLDPARKRQPVPPRYGRYVYPGPPQRVVIRLIEAMGGFHYLLSSSRKSRARSISLRG
jgi:N-carbamoylputrescine amidase